MTRKRNDNHSTEFGLWLRNQWDIASENGYNTTNVDYVWMYGNPENPLWMYIEEKRYKTKPTWSQRMIFRRLHKAALNDPNYRGLHILIFEKTSPGDGQMWLNDEKITTSKLMSFLKFEINISSWSEL